MLLGRKQGLLDIGAALLSLVFSMHCKKLCRAWLLFGRAQALPGPPLATPLITVIACDAGADTGFQERGSKHYTRAKRARAQFFGHAHEVINHAP